VGRCGVLGIKVEIQTTQPPRENSGAPEKNIVLKNKVLVES